MQSFDPIIAHIREIRSRSSSREVKEFSHDDKRLNWETLHTVVAHITEIHLQQWVKAEEDRVLYRIFGMIKDGEVPSDINERFPYPYGCKNPYSFKRWKIASNDKFFKMFYCEGRFGNAFGKKYQEISRNQQPFMGRPENFTKVIRKVRSNIVGLFQDKGSNVKSSDLERVFGYNHYAMQCFVSDNPIMGGWALCDCRLVGIDLVADRISPAVVCWRWTPIWPESINDGRNWRMGRGETKQIRTITGVRHRYFNYNPHYGDTDDEAEETKRRNRKNVNQWPNYSLYIDDAMEVK